MIELFDCLKVANTKVTTYTCEKRTKRALFLLNHKQIAKTKLTEYDCISCAECPNGANMRVEIVKGQGYDKSHNWSYRLHKRAA